MVTSSKRYQEFRWKSVSGQGFCVQLSAQKHPELVLEEKDVLKVWEFPAQFSSVLGFCRGHCSFSVGLRLSICSNKGNKTPPGLILDWDVPSTSAGSGMAQAEGDTEDICPHTQPADRAGRDLAAQTEI